MEVSLCSFCLNKLIIKWFTICTHGLKQSVLTYLLPPICHILVPGTVSYDEIAEEKWLGRWFKFVLLYHIPVWYSLLIWDLTQSLAYDCKEKKHEMNELLLSNYTLLLLILSGSEEICMQAWISSTGYINNYYECSYNNIYIYVCTITIISYKPTNCYTHHHVLKQLTRKKLFATFLPLGF